jgi:UDP-N-acetylmuramoyl-tripeptide--D-alanyl-D-alanine ligase
VRDWSPEQVAAGAQARLLTTSTAEEGPRRVTIDSREVGPGDLFVGLPGSRADGGAFAAAALERGAWGTLTTPEHAEQLPAAGVVLEADDPLAALQALATAWRTALGAHVIGVTGSTGKTSTKDLLTGMLRPHRRTVATPQNLNTEIGLPLTILSAPGDTEVLVLEMAMRGAGQIAQLAEIAQPDVGVIVNIGPVHLALLGSIEAIAAAKAELIAGLKAGGTAIVPADEPLLEVGGPHFRDDVTWVTFGPGGDVSELGDVRIPFDSRHMRTNALAALAAARAVGVQPSGDIEVRLSARRGQRIELASGAVVVNDCYNASPMSMRAALDELSRAPGRRVAVLGDMLELGPEELRYHQEIGAYAREHADVIVTVGPRAAAMAGDLEAVTAAEAVDIVRELMRPGDTILVKGSRGVGLEAVAEAL